MRLIALLIIFPTSVLAGPFLGEEAHIFVLGEIHDNAAHHIVQAEAVNDIGATAVVFEMLTEAQASKVGVERPGDPDELSELLEWDQTGWPDFEMYFPIFEALGSARVVGAAVPRDATQRALQRGVAEAFGTEAGSYGLTDALPAEQLAERLNLQLAAHCGKLPVELLPGMVDIQRLRDATLARAAIEAYRSFGGPVVVVTGNGHARNDWGVPSYIERVAPELSVLSLGQSENGNVPDGGFDLTLDAPGMDHDDPCAAFE